MSTGVGWLANPATTQDQNQGCELAHPHCNIQPICSVGAHGRPGPADSKLQDLHDTGQQQIIQEESQWEPSINSVAETRGLEPDRWLQLTSASKDVCDSLCCTMASMLKFFCFFLLYFILLNFIGEVVTRAKCRNDGTGKWMGPRSMIWRHKE